MAAISVFVRDAWSLAVPYFRSEERWKARALLGAVIALQLLSVVMDLLVSYWNRAFFNAIQDKSWDQFVKLLTLYGRVDGLLLPGLVSIIVVYVLVTVNRAYFSQALQIRWRRWMTERYLDQWLSRRTYYLLSIQRGAAEPDADNPDQRIAEDLSFFIGDGLAGRRGLLALAIDFLSNAVSLAGFLFVLWSLSGSFTVFGIAIPGYMVWAGLIYASVGTWLTHRVGRPLVALNFEKQRVEADFRFALARLRENAEGVALARGEGAEHKELMSRFMSLVRNWHGLMRRNRRLLSLTTTYGQIALLFPTLVASPRYFAGDITLGGLLQTSGAFYQVQGAMSWFVNAYGDLASWRATTSRLTIFRRAMATAERVLATSREGQAAASSSAFMLDNLSVSMPGTGAFTQSITTELAPGQSTLVTGRVGAGKSTLFRTLAGIWPFFEGRIRRPAADTLFLTQRPYLPIGTLRAALCYPDDPSRATSADLCRALAEVGLDELIGLLDTHEAWSVRLSSGELQRLGIARALVKRPDWLFLDEATTNLDANSEQDLYRKIKCLLPRTTVVTISHRAIAEPFHDRQLMVERIGRSDANPD